MNKYERGLITYGICAVGTFAYLYHCDRLQRKIHYRKDPDDDLLGSRACSKYSYPHDEMLHYFVKFKTVPEIIVMSMYFPYTWASGLYNIIYKIIRNPKQKKITGGFTIDDSA
jgi:hypothetical protein